MGRNQRRRRTGVLVTTAALAALAVFPAGAGAVAPPPDLPDAGTLTLAMGAAGDAFTYAPPAGKPLVQTLSAARCVLASDGSLVTVTGPKPVGLVGHSLGVKSGGSTGTPCGRIDRSETLTLALAGPLADFEVDHAELDVEAKGSAVAVATLTLDGAPVGTRTLRTGTSIVGNPAGTVDCSAASDSGPDAGAADNCRWEITGALFDAITLTVTTGELSLEGGGDYARPGNETVFHLTDVDVLECGETDTVTVPGSTNELTNVLGDGCVPVVYVLRPYGNSGVWLWKDPATAIAQLVWTTVWEPEEAPTGGDLQIPPTLLDLDPDDAVDPAPFEWCGLADGAYVVPEDPGWCMAAQSAVTVGDGLIQVTDTAVGNVDPFKLR